MTSPQAYLYAIERYGIEPDMIALGKGLGGGSMPLAMRFWM
jgi:4-aminobutyrate aminotransferase